MLSAPIPIAILPLLSAYYELGSEEIVWIIVLALKTKSNGNCQGLMDICKFCYTRQVTIWCVILYYPYRAQTTQANQHFFFESLPVIRNYF